jgi:hypothetical protein
MPSIKLLKQNLQASLRLSAITDARDFNDQVPSLQNQN